MTLNCPSSTTTLFPMQLASSSQATSSALATFTNANNELILPEGDIFALWDNPEFVVGMQAWSTIQPIVGGKFGGYFIKQESINSCQWTATEEDFSPGSVKYNTEHTFSSGTSDQGHFFIEPRMQIIHASELLICEADGRNLILGDFSKDENNEYNFPVLLADFEQDKTRQKRKYGTRRKYLVRLMTMEGTPAHNIPIVLTLKGIASKRFHDAYSTFKSEMEKCICAYNGSMAMKYNNFFHSTCIFIPTLERENYTPEGRSSSVAVVGLKEYLRPSYTTKEEAGAFLKMLTITRSAYQSTFEIEQDPVMRNFVNYHSMSDAKKLQGSYGVAEGVSVMPATVKTVESNQNANVKVEYDAYDILEEKPSLAALTGEDSLL
jgi:hypothetical protein